jgi:hypothetical protein
MEAEVPMSTAETAPCELKAKASTRGTDFDAVWQRYCDVIRDLEMTAAELEALRTCRE